LLVAKFDLIRSSFEKGEISYSKVRAMTRVATQENESVLMQVALHGTAHHVETTVRKYRRACDRQIADTATAQYEGRGLGYRHEEDDSIVIRVRLPPEQGAILVRVVQAVANRMCQEERDSAEASRSDEGGDAAEAPHHDRPRNGRQRLVFRDDRLRPHHLVDGDTGGR
jgi:hypothetical protein